MIPAPSTDLPPIQQVLDILVALRSPEGCPWDQEQDHASLRWHAVEEVYELLDAIDSGDDGEMEEELGDLLLQVVFHSQIAQERQSFDFQSVCRRLAAKLVRRHPHVFGEVQVADVDQVWKNWERIKREEKQGTVQERASAFDGIPRHLPALMRAQKLFRKAKKSGVAEEMPVFRSDNPTELGKRLFEIACQCQEQGVSAEDLLREVCHRQEQVWRQREQTLSEESQTKQNSLPL